MQRTDDGPDLGRAIEESYGDGPPHRALEPVLQAGRRVRLRRRVLQVAAAAAAGVALFVATTQAVDTFGGREAEVVAGPSAPAPASPTPSPTPSTKESPTEESPPTRRLEPQVRFADGGQLRAVPPAVLVSQTGDFDLGPRFAGSGDRTAAAEVTWEGERWYVLARQIDDGPAEYFPAAATKKTPTLDDFLAEAQQRYADGTGLR